MRHRRSRERHQTVAELNITAFLNLMVVLVPFLLMTAVFTHLTILELNLPNPEKSTANSKDKPSFNLQIAIRRNALVLSDTKGGLIKRIPKTGNGHNYALLTATLKQVKARFPDKTNATILAEQNTAYDTLVHVMDAVRMYTARVDGEWVQAELFPNISIGDAR
jgi:biopolymer transport protein ExbD